MVSDIRSMVALEVGINATPTGPCPCMCGVCYCFVEDRNYVAIDQRVWTRDEVYDIWVP